MEKVNLSKKFSLFDEYWSPKIVGELNGQYVKIAKLKGEFLWHYHEDEDELFMVIRGRLTIRLPGRDLHLDPGEFFIVPHGTEHMPVAEEETHILLFEPASTLHTGNVRHEKTVDKAERI